jgi:hypothetical protein
LNPFGVIVVDELRFSTAGVGFTENVASPTPLPISSPHQPAPGPTETPPKGAMEPYKWIMGPVIDMLFVCGGFFWLLILGLYATGFKVDLYGSPGAFTLATISVLGLQLMGDAHQPATLFRVYGSKQTRDKLGVKVALIGVLAIAVGLCTFFVASTTTLFLKIILAWGIQHQLAQSYGIALVYCYKRKYYLNKLEKQSMFVMVQATIIYMIVRMFAVKDFAEFTLNRTYNVPFWQFLPEWAATVAGVALGVSILVFAGMVARKYMQDKQMFPVPGLCALMTLIALAVIPGDKFLIIWYLFSTWWFHSCQYLVITTAFYLKERGLPAHVSFHEIGKMMWSSTFAKYYSLLFGFGFVVYYLWPNWMVDHGAEKAIALAAVYVASNLHHYITDALIWKLRDPAVQKLLIA